MKIESEAILEALKAGRFLISFHAAERMLQRSVTKADIQACGRTVTACIYQEDRETYRIQGQDLDGEPLTVVCGVDDVAVIVTVY